MLAASGIMQLPAAQVGGSAEFEPGRVQSFVLRQLFESMNEKKGRAPDLREFTEL